MRKRVNACAAVGLVGTRSSGLDLVVELDQYKETDPEGKYTKGLYSKVQIMPSQHEEPPVSEDELMDVVHSHLGRLSDDVILLRKQIEESFERMDAMERRTDK